MRNYTKHLSFDFPIQTSFLTEWKNPEQPVIYVRYTLDWRGVVQVEGYTVKPGMAQHIVKWEQLEDEMLKAAENNSKDYRRPGHRSGGRAKQHGNDPYNDIHDQWKQEIHEKENHGW